MTHPVDPSDPILEGDLHAYVDDQLAPTRRIEVEAYLSRNPRIAARVMSDLRARDELRLTPRGAAAHLRHRHGRRGPAPRARARPRSRALAHSARGGAGGLRGGRLDRPCAARRLLGGRRRRLDAAARLRHRRADVPSHRAAARLDGLAAARQAFDRAEIRSQTAIVLPTLPAGWRVVRRPGLPVAFRAERRDRAQRRADGHAVALRLPPRLVLDRARRHDLGGRLTAAYWQMGEVAYALVGKAAGDRTLTEAAEKLSESLH